MVPNANTTTAETIQSIIRMAEQESQRQFWATFVVGGAILLAYAIACAILGYAVGEFRGRSWFGFALGFFLGPVGVLTALLLPSAQTPGAESPRVARLKPHEQEATAWLDRLR